MLGRAKRANRTVRQQSEAAPTSRVGGGSLGSGAAEARATEESWPLLPVPEGLGEKYPGTSALLFPSLLPVPPIGQT